MLGTTTATRPCSLAMARLWQTASASSRTSAVCAARLVSSCQRVRKEAARQKDAARKNTHTRRERENLLAMRSLHCGITSAIRVASAAGKSGFPACEASCSAHLLTRYRLGRTRGKTRARIFKRPIDRADNERESKVRSENCPT